MVIYVNTGFHNECTLDRPMQDEVDEFGDITWRQLLCEVLEDPLPTDAAELSEHLEDRYGINPSRLGHKLSHDTVDAYQNDIAYWVDNISGGEARAHDLVKELGILVLDDEDSGSSHGVHLWRTTADGPRKFLVVEDEDAAHWLTGQFNARGLAVEIRFT